MDAKDWETIVALFETKNVTKAAKKLFMTQPALSLRLKNIEQFFNATIVLRGNKGIQFTAEGEYLVQVAREQVKTMARVRDVLADMQGAVSGVLRIGSTNYTTKFFLPHILREFRETYPLVEFRVSSGMSNEVIPMVHDNEVHVGFIRGVSPWEGEKHLLLNEKLFIVNKEPFDIDQLDAMPYIHYQIAPANQEQLDKWWEERFAKPPMTPMTVDRADTCLELISQGFGFGFLPESILMGQEHLARREMHFLSGDPVERNVWLILHRETRQLRLVDAFVETVTSLDYSVLSVHGGDASP